MERSDDNLGIIRLLRHLASLEKKVGAFAPRGLFKLDGASYPKDWQNGIDLMALQRIARDMACFINMPFFCITVTPARQEDSVAGHIEGHHADAQNVYIEIEPAYLNHPMAAIKVLAHEISHKYLAFHALALDSTEEDEIRTDVAAIYLGFGTFALNGGVYQETLRQDARTIVNRTITNGYLDADENAFVYDVMCQLRGFDDAATLEGLSAEAADRVRHVRRRYAAVYPPRSPDVSPIKAKMADARDALERADLELCSIDKIKLLFPGAVAGKVAEIDSIRKDVVTTRCALLQMESEVDAAAGTVACLGIPVWKAKVDELVELSSTHLAVLQPLGAFVLRRVPPDITSASWDARPNLVIECPKCRGKLRLPTGKPRLSVSCPRCGYGFGYSTTCPDFRWDPPKHVEEEPLPRRRLLDWLKLSLHRRKRMRVRPIDDHARSTKPRYACSFCGTTASAVQDWSHVHLLFLGVYISWRVTSGKACARCARRCFLKELPLDILCANVLWPFIFFVWDLPQLAFGLVNDHACKKHWKAAESRRWERSCAWGFRTIAIIGVVWWLL